jgi:hypothetical protein
VNRRSSASSTSACRSSLRSEDGPSGAIALGHVIERGACNPTQLSGSVPGAEVAERSASDCSARFRAVERLSVKKSSIPSPGSTVTGGG